MKSHVKSKDWAPDKSKSGITTELDAQLTEALDRSISDLSSQFDAIVRKYKGRGKSDHCA
jgi:hypothetical protein